MNQTKQTSNQTNINKVTDFFESLGNKAFFVALFLIALVAFFAFKDFILLKNVFLFKDIGSDTLNGVYPSYYFAADYFQKNGLPGWSFQEGMGQNILGLYTRDPFLLIAVFLGPQSIPKILVFLELFKILIGGSLFYFYLKSLKISNYSAIIGSLLFSFSGFMIIGACWYVFTFEALTFALLLLGFERLYQKNKWMLFAFGIFLTALSMPFNIYIFGLFIAIYAAFRFLQENTFEIKKIFQLYWKLILAGLVGMLIAGPFLLENIFQIIESPRGSGGNSYFDKLSGSPLFALSNKVEFGSSIMRMLSTDAIGTGNNFTGVQNFLEAPLSYCGLISLLLMAQVFPLVDKKIKRYYIALFVIWIIPTIFPWFRYAFWLFTGDYFRAYSFFVSVVFILFSVYALDLILKYKKVSIVALAVALGVWIILSSLSYKALMTYPGGQQGEQALKVNDSLSLFIKAFLIFYAIAIYFLGRSKNIANVKYLILLLVVIELGYFSYTTLNTRSVLMQQEGRLVPAAVSSKELKEKTAYNDYSVEAINYIKNQEKDDKFYRVDKMYFSSGAMHGSLQDHKRQGFYSTSSYNSFAQMNYINFMRGFNAIDKNSEFASRWVDGLKNRPFLESLNNVKYVLTKNTNINPVWSATHDSVAKFGDVIVLKNKYSLPFGYTYDRYVDQSAFDNLSPTQKDLVSLRACVIDDKEISKTPGLIKFELKDTISLNYFTWDYFKNNVDTLKKESMTTTLFSENKIEGNIKVSENKIMYLSFPYDKGWHLKIDGKEAEKILVNYGMTGVYLTKGEHKINLEYHLRFFKKGLILTLIGIVLAGGLWFFTRKKLAITN
ncbi:MAG: YfhO family protein [Bacteroidota bacterium]|nr:YfhO family protein [Bacteroidota bacterium]MDP3144699.1 YfhO family protein [Bacteroidota bacterium]